MNTLTMKEIPKAGTGRRRGSRLLTFVLVLAPIAARAQVELGVVGGVALAGRQDLTIERRSSPEGTVLSVTREPSLPVRDGSAEGLTYTRWTRSHATFGLSIDALYWSNSLTMLRLDTGHSPRLLHQERVGVFPSLAARVPLDAVRGIFAVGSIGAGVVDSRLVSGDQRVGEAYVMTAGISAPLSEKHLVARLEARYLITHDFDSDDGNDQNLEFSGSRSSLTARRVLGVHEDTRFFPLLAGLSWRF